MITALVLGAGCGIGIWAVVVGALPPRPGLGAVLRRVDTTPEPPSITAQEQAGWAARLGKPFVAPLAALGLPSPALRKDIAITGQSVDGHLADKAALGIAGLLLPTLVSLALTALGMPLPWEVSLIASVLIGVVGFLLPDLTLRRRPAPK